MKRLVVGALLLAATGLALAAGRGGDDDVYRVRAQFDNALSVLPGMDVKVAGVRVGSVHAVDVDDDDPRRPLALVDLDVEDTRFQDFRADAHCSIHPQSLIGERFVDCIPSRSGAAAPLRELDGRRLLGVANTSSPVDVDLILDTLRLPVRQRMSIVLNELGTGLAGNGGALREVIRRADPSLAQTQRLVAVLARERTSLTRLAEDLDTVLAPLARERRAAGRLLRDGSLATGALASRRDDLARALALLPTTLARLGPALDGLDSLSAELGPASRDLRAAAPSLARGLEALEPVAENATPALKALGDTARTGTKVLPAAVPTFDRLASTAGQALGAADPLAALLVSLRDTGGVENLLGLVFNAAGAVNGFDRTGHYVRAGLILNLCSTYSTTPSSGCSANFIESSPAERAAAAAPDAVLDYLLGNR